LLNPIQGATGSLDEHHNRYELKLDLKNASLISKMSPKSTIMSEKMAKMKF
jgi:hypothetical protein